MNTVDKSMALTGEPPKALNAGQKIAVLIGMTGMGRLRQAYAL